MSVDAYGTARIGLRLEGSVIASDTFCLRSTKVASRRKLEGQLNVMDTTQHWIVTSLKRDAQPTDCRVARAPDASAVAQGLEPLDGLPLSSPLLSRHKM